MHTYGRSSRNDYDGTGRRIHSVVSLRSAYYAFETTLIAPGIVTHEGAHLLACRLRGIDVHGSWTLDPWASETGIVHERVEEFGDDLAIALAPLGVNTLLGLACFVLATRLAGLSIPIGGPDLLLSVPFYWLGACFALTAFPSVGDTETLYRTASGLPRSLRPLGVSFAVLLRGFTLVPGSAGVAGFLWVLVLYAGGTGL